MADNLRRLRDAVLQRGREVEVTEQGEVREAKTDDAPDATPKKSTKLSARTFGGPLGG